MKTQVVKTLSAGLMLAALSACSFGGDSTADQNKTYLDDRSRILSQYQPVLGTYDGEVSANVRDSEDPTKMDVKIIKVRFVLYTQDVQTGHDANGQATPLPALVVKYQQQDVVRPDELIEARYVQGTGSLSGSNATSINPPNSGNGGSGNGNSAGSNAAVSICSTSGMITTSFGTETRIVGDKIIGSIWRNNGKLGNFTATRTSLDTPSTATDPITDCNDRLAAEYNDYQGVYKGTIQHTPENGGETTDLTLTLSFSQIGNANALPSTTLLGAITYHGSNDPSVLPTTFGNMPVIFRPEKVPVEMTMSYFVPSVGGGGFTMSGVLEGDTFTGEAYSGNLGHLGHVVVKKTTSSKPKPRQ